MEGENGRRKYVLGRNKQMLVFVGITCSKEQKLNYK